ncbi:hypothetical protein BGZ50_001754 [Haplosporangium sp. Z 11]|nr:hypothetical protein BGZ50_001754 [Haplosporangium sp. Z 11]
MASIQRTKILGGTTIRTCFSRSPLMPHRPALTAYKALAWSQERGFKLNVLQVRKGYVVDINNTLSVVLKRETSVMGRGTSTVKDLLTGTKHTERFRSGDMVEVTELEDHKCQYLYRDGGKVHLMDPNSFEMYEIPESLLEDRQIQMLQPDMQVQLSLFHPDPDVPAKPISIKLPAQSVYEVKEAHASAAQANKGTIYKNADLENGIKVQVPDFVNVGDKVVVDTETGKYVRRA